MSSRIPHPEEIWSSASFQFTGDELAEHYLLWAGGLGLLALESDLITWEFEIPQVVKDVSLENGTGLIAIILRNLEDESVQVLHAEPGDIITLVGRK